jgi:cell division protease FtsH
LKKLKVVENLDVERISRETSGFTGSDIASVCNEAGLIAVQHDKKEVDIDCIEEAIDKKVFKGNRSKTKEEFKKDKEITAYHEAGHAVMKYLLGLPISRASIQATTSGVGGVVWGADSDSQFTTKKEYENQVKAAYAGRISESIMFDSITTGASSDITKATQILKAYVGRFGFDDEFGLIDMSVINKDTYVSDDKTLERVQTIAKTLYSEADKLLRDNYNLVSALALELLDKESMGGDEIKALFDSLYNAPKSDSVEYSDDKE